MSDHANPGEETLKETMREITTALAKELIDKQFPQWSHLEIWPVQQGGYDNYTFHLGDQMSIRMPRDEEHSLQVEKEAFWLPKLKPQLTLPIPVPLAKGSPTEEYPLPWSVNQWVFGENLTAWNIKDKNEFARDLASFLLELQHCDTTGAPFGSLHNYYRGCPLTSYEFHNWTMEGLEFLGNQVNRQTCLDIWKEAVSTEWSNKPVWIHGDIAPGNLLVSNGKLSAVIDFGVMAIGDPAADYAIAWTYMDDESRKVFFETLCSDRDTINRAKGWVLWKALTICMWDKLESDTGKEALQIIRRVTEEH